MHRCFGRGRSLGRALLVSGLVAATAAGCGHGGEGASGPRTGIDIALKRGPAWTTFNVTPSRVIGPAGTLNFRKGELVGFLEGHAVKLEVKPDELTGTAGGRVALDIYDEPGKIEISGVWNDARVHFEITPETLRGTITGGTTSMMGTPYPFSCQYVLDKLESDGARTGTSICSGMPEPTRLEFPPTVEKWLSRGEIVVVLLALFASAPMTSTD